MKLVQRLDNWWEQVSPKRRLDRGPVYLCVLLGLAGPALSIILFGPVPNNAALLGMSDGLQIAMCGLIFLHCVLGLHAACAGARFYFPAMTAKRAYRLGYSAAPAGVAALCVYGAVILSNAFQAVTVKIAVVSALSGILTPALGVGIAVQAVLFWLESRRIDRNEQAIIAGMGG